MSYEQAKMWIVDKLKNELKNTEEIQEAALWIKKGDVVAFPTETVYGLGANANDDDAVEKIYLAKGRPSDNPLIVHIANREQMIPFVKEISHEAAVLMDSFWPGPLAIILPVKEGVLSKRVTAGLQTVAIRMPAHPVALALIEAAGVPVAAPSANLSGKPSPTRAEHVWNDLNEKIVGILDGGPTGVGVESTVIDCTVSPPMILRPGGITKEQAETVIGRVSIDPALQAHDLTPKSPGLKYTHYAPKATLVLVNRYPERLQQLVNEKRASGIKVGVLATEESVSLYDADVVLSCGTRSHLASVAANLYSVLRSFDDTDVGIILAETFPKDGVGAAIMNRLEKAAGGKIE